MIFDEKYSIYYKTVREIMNSLISDPTIKTNDLLNIAERNGVVRIDKVIDPIFDFQAWNLASKQKGNYSSKIKYPIDYPMTLLEKRWLKAISLDPRIKLFGLEFEGLEDIEPLFLLEDYVVYDKRNNGDKYTDPEYIKKFQFLLYSIRNKKRIHIQSMSRKGNVSDVYCEPTDLEYSEKDDKFRLRVKGRKYIGVVNIDRIFFYELFEGEFNYAGFELDNTRKKVELIVTDERNTLDRCMLHFAYFHTAVEPIEGTNQYRVHIEYDNEDLSEMVIRVLMFGPYVEVTNPPEFRQAVVAKLEQQYKLQKNKSY